MKHLYFIHTLILYFFLRDPPLPLPPPPPQEIRLQNFRHAQKGNKVIFSKVKDGVGTSLLQSGTIRKSLIVSWISEGMQGVFLISFLCT